MRPEVTTASSKCGGTSSRSSGQSSKAGLRSVHGAESTVITSHGEANHQAIRMQVHKASIQYWSTDLHHATSSVRFNWAAGDRRFARSGAPHLGEGWRKYIDAGCWCTSISTKTRRTSRKWRALYFYVRAGKKAYLSCRGSVGCHRGEDRLLFHAFTWSTLVSSCRSSRCWSTVYCKVSRDRLSWRGHAHGFGYLFRGLWWTHTFLGYGGRVIYILYIYKYFMVHIMYSWIGHMR